MNTTQIEKEKTRTTNKISQPISIPTSITTSKTSSSIINTTQNQYSLKQNCFNPNKASPPNSWNYRLMQRISESNNMLMAGSP